MQLYPAFHNKKRRFDHKHIYARHKSGPIEEDPPGSRGSLRERICRIIEYDEKGPAIGAEKDEERAIEKEVF